MIAPRFYSLWSINGALDQARLRRQLEQLKASGLDGVVWHPRFYPGQPPYLGEDYLREVTEIIRHAKAVGMAFWIYDEDGWPSGTVSGQLLKKYPEDAQRWAELVTQKPERCLAEFTHKRAKWFLAERIGKGVDYFNPALARHFIELTYERYRAGLAPDAWEHVEAIFCDEPEFGLGHAYDGLSPHGAIPWTPDLPRLFRERFGEELLPQVGKLFFGGAGAAGVRVRFWELLTDLFNESFTAPMNEWCRRNGKRFTAHVKGEEHPLFQVPTNGSCHQFFRQVSLPGIDVLERYPGNHFYPRQVSAAARQFSDGRCMAEAFGGAGWGGSPEDLERYLLWLGRHGLTDFVMHLCQYRLDSPALRDWPPSQPLHLTWREVYPGVLNRVRRELGSHARPPAELLVVAPNRGIMAGYEPRELLKTNIHNAATYPATVAGKINRRFMEQIEQLHSAGVNYDIADERTVEEQGKVKGNKLVIGQCQYRHVLVMEGCQLEAAVAEAIKPLPGEVTMPAVKIKPVAGKNRPGRAMAVHWKLEKHPLNSLMLEPILQADGWFEARFNMGAPITGLKVLFADEGTRAEIRASGVGPEFIVRFQPLKPVEQPFLWLKGQFRVMSQAPFANFGEHAVKTTGPFSVHAVRDDLGQDLIADGFPFLFEVVEAVAELELPGKMTALRFEKVEADAVKLVVDGQDLGWAWPHDGAVAFGVKLAAGKHRLQIRLLPNSFNYYGPHHYYRGDWPVISPGQMRGVRNFADAPDAPARTHVADWHFRKFHLPANAMVT